MKNFAKVNIALAVIVIFAAVSCAPEVEITDYDWSDVKASRDPTQNGGDQQVTPPTASITDTTYSATAVNTITGFDITLTLDQRSDVFKKGEIKKADLDFITFHTFTKPASGAAFDAVDTLSSPITFTLEKVVGNELSLKLTTSIDTAAQTYSDIIMRVDGKKYTYDGGTRLDVDTNGRIEDVYDDEFIRTLSVSGTGGGIKVPSYIGRGQKALSIALPAVIAVDSIPATATPSTKANEFEFVGTAQTTNGSKAWYAIRCGFITSTTSTAEKDYIHDWYGALAKGIKLQKLSASGDRWEDYKTAEYDSEVRSSSTFASDNSGYTYIVFKDVSFDHFATYRLIWTGGAYTETTGTYWGVKQRLYVSNGSSGGAARYTRTQVAGAHETVVNENRHMTIPSTLNLTTKAYSYDSEGRNVVLTVELGKDGGDQYFWNSTVEDIKKSLKVLYSTQSLASASDTTPNLIEVDVVKVELKDEYDGGGAAVTAANPTGNNVLYITLDPNFSKNIANKGFFRVNKDVSVTNKLTGADEQTYHFGTASPIYDHFAFYGPFNW